MIDNVGRTTEAYIRRKGDKFVIEQKQDGKTKYLATLPDALTLFELIKGRRLDEKEPKASQNTTKTEQIKEQRFAHDLLNEALEKDAKRKITEEEIKLLWELTKE